MENGSPGTRSIDSNKFQIKRFELDKPGSKTAAELLGGGERGCDEREILSPEKERNSLYEDQASRRSAVRLRT
jgi:hypothetical protein